MNTEPDYATWLHAQSIEADAPRHAEVASMVLETAATEARVWNAEYAAIGDVAPPQIEVYIDPVTE